MRWKSVLFAGSLAPLTTGCLMFETAGRNIINEPLEYMDQKKITHESKAEAHRVWNEICSNHPPETFSHDFAKGFKDAYADYLDHGGPGTPPALPPKHYQRSHFYTPEGHARIRDWFAGYQQGLDAVKESGKRGFMTVPVLLPEPVKSPTLDVRQIPSEDCTPAGNNPRKPTRDVGPGPKPAPVPKPAEPMTGLPQPERPSTALPMPKEPVAPPIPAPVPTPPPSAPAPPISMPLPMPRSQVDPAPTYKPAVQPTTAEPVRLPGTNAVTANDDGTLKSGKFVVSPVREGLRVIVKPVRDPSEK